MAKLKEKDKRPTHIFQLGDIVRLHHSVKNMNIPGDGIVIRVDEDWLSNKTVHCIFAAREVDLWKAARSFAINITTISSYLPGGTVIIEQGKLQYVRNQMSWLKPPTSKDISNLRFSDLLDEMP